MGAFRTDVQDGTHLAARAVEAQDVALVEVHAHHVGALSIGGSLRMRLNTRPGSCGGQRDVGPLRSTAQGNVAARLRTAADPARTRLQTLALYINKVDAGRLRGDERRVAALLHLQGRRLEQLAVGRVDAHMHGTRLAGVENQRAVAHRRVRRQDGFRHTLNHLNILNSSRDARRVHQAQDVRAAERHRCNVGIRKVGHCHFIDRGGLTTRRESDVNRKIHLPQHGLGEE